MDDDFEFRRRNSFIMGWLVLPVYYSAILVHWVFGSRDDRPTDEWENRIRYRTFLQGIPAIAAVIAATTVGFLGWRSSFSSEIRYVRGAQDAMEKQDYATAEICYSRLLGIRPEERQYRFGMGTTLIQRGDVARGEQLISALAPHDGLGFAPAHLWVIDRLLEAARAGDPQSRAALRKPRRTSSDCATTRRSGRRFAIR